MIPSLADRYDNPICRTGTPGFIGWRNYSSEFLGSINVYKYGLRIAGSRTDSLGWESIPGFLKVYQFGLCLLFSDNTPFLAASFISWYRTWNRNTKFWSPKKMEIITICPSGLVHYPCIIYDANQNINVTFDSHSNYITIIARSTLYRYNRSISSPFNVLSSNEAKLNKAEYYMLNTALYTHYPFYLLHEPWPGCDLQVPAAVCGCRARHIMSGSPI